MHIIMNKTIFIRAAFVFYLKMEPLQRISGTWENIIKCVDPAQTEEIKRIIGARIIQENLVFLNS